MKAYKGFNKDMTCRGFQFDEGKEYEEEKAIPCICGFHACEMPLNVLHYYNLNDSVFYEVEQSGTIVEHQDKTVSTKIKIGARLSIKDIVKAQIEIVFKKVKKSNTATSGDLSSAATSGYKSSAATSGDWSSAATSGYKSSAATSGDWSSAATNNKNAIALACGKNARAKGAVGSYIVLTEWNDDNTEMIFAKMRKIDGKKLKADTWYKLENGKFVEVKESEG